MVNLHLSRAKEKEYVVETPDAVIEARRQRLYKRQLTGKTTRQLVLEHASREGIGIETAWSDWKEVKKWNDEDWEKDREKMISRLQGMRMRLFDKACKKRSVPDCCSDIRLIR